MYHDTPDKLFDQFSTLVVSLPVKASGWSVQLYSSYLAALSKDLSEYIAAAKSTFVMLDLTTLTTKSLQRDALRNIRNYASTGFKNINKKKDEKKELFHEIQAVAHPKHSSGVIAIRCSETARWTKTPLQL